MTKTGYYIDEKIAAVRALHTDVLSQPHGNLTVRELLSTQAENIVAGHQSGDTAVVFHLTCWCPGLVGQSADQIMNNSLSLAQAQSAIAREYGYNNWDDVPLNTSVNSLFETAIDLMIHGELDELSALLRSDSSLVYKVSSYGHRATLLHYLGANGVETHRQVTPYNAASMAEKLLHHGADTKTQANIYGGSDPLTLIETSIHPAKAGITDSLVKIFRSARG